VGQRAAHSLEEQRVVRVLENAAMSLLLDVLEILAGRSARGISLAHVAQAPSELSELFTISAFTEPVYSEMIGLDKGGTREEGEAGLGVNQRSSRWTVVEGTASGRKLR
jgi:hypothetical protein